MSPDRAQIYIPTQDIGADHISRRPSSPISHTIYSSTPIRCSYSSRVVGSCRQQCVEGLAPLRTDGSFPRIDTATRVHWTADLLPFACLHVVGVHGDRLALSATSSTTKNTRRV